MKRPDFLSPGDRIAIVAPAGKLSTKSIDRAIELLKSWGLEVIIGRHVYGSHGYFSGTDNERRLDLQNAINDPTLAAILMARGGYGTTRILDKIDTSPLQETPKWIIGFSDITALHLRLLSEEQMSIHGDVATTLGRDDNAAAALKSLLFEGKSKITSAHPIRQGNSKAELTGGNLALLVDSLGTPTEVKTENRILFIEEIGEKAYRVDRMLNQLKRAGKLDHLTGLVLGDFTDITDGETSLGHDWLESVVSFTAEYSYPIAAGLQFGHEPVNYPIMHGATYKLNVDSEGVALELALD